MSVESDDVWGDGDEGDTSVQDLSREAAARDQAFYTAGYRDGLDEGKVQTLQHGFNIGFKEGAQAGLEWGRMSAYVKTLQIFVGRVAGTSHLQEAVGELSKQLSQITLRQAMLSACNKQLAHVPQTSGDAAGSLAVDGTDDAHTAGHTSTGCEAGSSAVMVLPSGRSEADHDQLASASTEELTAAMLKLPGLIATATDERHRQLVGQASLPDVDIVIHEIQKKIQGLGFHLR